MTDQEAADFLSKEWKRPVALDEAEKINRDLTALTDILIDGYYEFKKKGLIDKKGHLIPKDSNGSARPRKRNV